MKHAANLRPYELRLYRFMRAELAREIRALRREFAAVAPVVVRNKRVRWHAYHAFGFRCPG